MAFSRRMDGGGSGGGGMLSRPKLVYGGQQPVQAPPGYMSPYAGGTGYTNSQGNHIPPPTTFSPLSGAQGPYDAYYPGPPSTRPQPPAVNPDGSPGNTGPGGVPIGSNGQPGFGGPSNPELPGPGDIGNTEGGQQTTNQGTGGGQIQYGPGYTDPGNGMVDQNPFSFGPGDPGYGGSMGAYGYNPYTGMYLGQGGEGGGTYGGLQSTPYGGFSGGGGGPSGPSGGYGSTPNPGNPYGEFGGTPRPGGPYGPTGTGGSNGQGGYFSPGATASAGQGSNFNQGAYTQGTLNQQVGGGAQQSNYSGTYGQTGGGAGTSNYSGTTGSQALSGGQSQYLIPGAQAAYQGLAGGLQNQYGQMSNYLGNANDQLQHAVLGGYTGLYNQANQNVKNYGTTALSELNDNYRQQQGQQDQSLVNRGLGNTTVQNAVNTGLEQSKGKDLINLRENISNMYNNVLGSFGNNLLGAQSGLGQNAISQQLALGQQGLLGQQGYGQQYLGLVGQQGINSQTGYQNSQGQQQGNQSNQYNQYMQGNQQGNQNQNYTNWQNGLSTTAGSNIGGSSYQNANQGLYLPPTSFGGGGR